MAEATPAARPKQPSVSVPVEPRDRGAAQALGAPLQRKVKESRVLVVGAGGIGCELLKNLVCCGFATAPRPDARIEVQDSAQTTLKLPAEIVVVDLDTIDLSNLNRQFLFRKQHIKKPKAFVAKATASQFNPAVHIDAHHGSIFDDKYDVDFFEGFDMVFNALDNLAARRHVNKMCLAADVPLIESGTTGFNGQVQAIRKGITECYDCNPKPVQKSFPICTIRSTPSQPIHCIVWAKSYLFPELFGTSEEDSKDVTVTESDNAEEVAKLKEEAEALKKIRSKMGKTGFAQDVFNKVFHDDIERLRSMTEMWQHRTPPESLNIEALAEEAAAIKRGHGTATQDQRAWTLFENIDVFCYSLDALSKRALKGEAPLEFDKDDKDTLDFVASTANLRSHIFGVPMNSEWEIKQMAGNIIPAIATSNALTASLCVLEAFKILRTLPSRTEIAAKAAVTNQTSSSSNSAPNGSKSDAPLGGAKLVFLTSRNTERMIASQSLLPPKPECAVCSPVYARLLIPSDSPSSFTLQDLVTLLKDRIGYDEFSIAIDSLGLIYDPDLEDNLGKPLTEWGVGSKNIFLTVMDDGSDETRVDLLLSAKILPKDKTEGKNEEKKLSLSPDISSLPLKPKKAPAEDADAAYANGDIEPMPMPKAGDSAAAGDSSAGSKRKRGPEDGEDRDEVNGSPATKKRAKAEEKAMVIDDDAPILLDD